MVPLFSVYQAEESGTQWWQIVVTVLCIILSGTFSGLTLGLMSLEIIELRVLLASGTEKEKWYARRIMPIRKRGNWLLCTLLIGNTAVNSALAIVSAGLFGGINGLVLSTIVILYLGEIIPQAVCHRFGLVIGAYAVPFVKLLMILTSPMSFTTAKVLDFLLGSEPSTRYNKSQLKSLLSIHGTQPNEMNHSYASSQGLQETQSTPPAGAVVLQVNQLTPKPSSSESFTPDNTKSQTAGLSESTPDIIERAFSSTGSESTPNPSSSDATRELDVSTGPSNPSSPRVMREKPSNPLVRLCGKALPCFKSRRDREGGEGRENDRQSLPVNTLPLTKEEVAMLGGAFDFSQKTVEEVMTPSDDVFMIEASLSLNFNVLLLIFQSGHSRVPVYEQRRDNIIGMLFAKDLILLDPEDCVPVKTVLLFFNRSILLVVAHTPLNEMLNIFRQGRGHMALVQAMEENEDGRSDVLGVVTLEDLIEELIGDIVDETDVYTDNVNKERVQRIRAFDPELLKMFDSKHDEDILSEKEVLVVSSYLSNNVEEFSSKFIDLDILRKVISEVSIVEYGDHPKSRRRMITPQQMESFDALGNRTGPSTSNSRNNSELNTTDRLEQSIADQLLNGEHHDQDDEEKATVYTRGVPTKNAYLIINGRLEITAGSDGFRSESGPWNLLGKAALLDDLYAPDFTAKVIERPTRLLCISRKLYRHMVQLSQKPTQPLKFGSSGPYAGMSGTTPQITSGAKPPANRPSSSLALQASAAALALGTPDSSSGIA